jgi:hypothetical protein
VVQFGFSRAPSSSASSRAEPFFRRSEGSRVEYRRRRRPNCTTTGSCADRHCDQRPRTPPVAPRGRSGRGVIS